MDEPHGRPAHDGRRGRHGRLGQRLRPAGEGRRRHDQRQERPELLRRPVPQAGRSRSTSGARATTCRRSRSAACRRRAYNETHWPPKSARARTSSASTSRRWPRSTRPSAASIIHEMQKLEYNHGGYIIPFFNNLVDALQHQGRGLQAEQGDAEPRRVRPWLPHHLVRLAASCRAGGPPLRRLSRRAHPAVGGIWGFILRRILLGLLVLFVVSVVVFAATQALPGDPARAILGRTATPDSLERAARSSCTSTSRSSAAVLELAHRAPARRPRARRSPPQSRSRRR